MILFGLQLVFAIWLASVISDSFIGKTILIALWLGFWFVFFGL
jgi:uncharacterized membrane protein